MSIMLGDSQSSEDMFEAGSTFGVPRGWGRPALWLW